MSYLDMQAYEELRRIRREEIRRWSETRHLLRQANLVQPGLFCRQRCWLLCHLGRWLVEVGERLEQRAVVQSLNCEVEVG
jgi:hypothetical protein